MKVYLDEIVGNPIPNPSKMILIPLCLSRDIVQTLIWAKQYIASKSDFIVIYHLLESLESDFETLKACGINADFGFLAQEYRQISKDLLAMTAKQFEDDGYNVITVALHTHPVGKEWSFDQLNASECVAVVGKKMVRHPSTFILFQPFVNHIFLET